MQTKVSYSDFQVEVLSKFFKEGSRASKVLRISDCGTKYWDFSKNCSCPIFDKFVFQSKNVTSSLS